MHKEYNKKKFIKNLTLLLSGFFVFFIASIILWFSIIRIPDFNSFDERKVSSSTKIYDRTGEVLLYDIHQDVKRTNIPFDQMGLYIKNATVAIEDANFYNHKGIKLTSIARAIISNFVGNSKTQGGSTITQQLVKNTLLTQKKTYTRKLKEWILSIKIDRSMSKEKILEHYLNEAPYGGNIYGIEEAAKTYFAKKAQDLTLAEAAYLAAIPQSPTFLSPYGKNKTSLDERKNLVLARMLEVKFITEEDYENAKKEEVTFIAKSTKGINAPHFVFFIKEYLEEKYGGDIVENGGLKVITTLDYNLQQKSEEIAKEGALENEKNWNGSNTGIVVIDPKTGQILTMVGSRDYFDKEIDGNYNIATANRQPGSSFKPFIYATAFNKGFTPKTVLFDLKTEFSTTCNAYGKALPGKKQETCYMPENYDGKTVGPISLRDALAQSRNIPAVKLFYLAGLKDSLKTAEDMGITTLKDISRYGLTLVIGGGEVSLLDITSAYGVFANNGKRNQYTGILKIENGEGKILEEYTSREKEVLPKNTALTISDVLSDNKARVPTFGENSVLEIKGTEVAVKTGTTNENKDAWTIGYTPSVVVGVWAGNNNNKPMKKGGSSVAGPIWNKVMIESLKILPNEKFEKPETESDPKKTKPILRGFWQGNENFFLDKISKKLATEKTPKETMEEKVLTNVHSILYWIDKSDIEGEKPLDPTDDSQFNHWEIPIQNWWASNSYKYNKTTAYDIPTSYDDVHNEESSPQISIIKPSRTIIYKPNETIQLQINSSGRFPLQKIDIFINDMFMGTSKPPFIFSFTPEELETLKEKNEIKLVSYDTVFNRTDTISEFTVKE